MERFVVVPNPFPPSPAWRISFGLWHRSVQKPLRPVCDDSSQPVAEEASSLPLETRELVHNVLWFGRGSLSDLEDWAVVYLAVKLIPDLDAPFQLVSNIWSKPTFQSGVLNQILNTTKLVTPVWSCEVLRGSKPGFQQTVALFRAYKTSYL